MKIVRRLIASALYRVAEEVDPEPEVVAWPFGLGFMGTVLGALAIGHAIRLAKEAGVDAEGAKRRTVDLLDGMKRIDAVVGAHLECMNKLASRVEALEAKVKSD